MIAGIIVLLVYLATVFFSVRMAIFAFLDIKYKDKTITAGDWGFALAFGLIPLINYVVAFICTPGKFIRKAHFLPPKRDKMRGKRYPYFRDFLGRVFMIEKG